MVNIKIKTDDDGLLLEAWDRFYEIQIPLSAQDARELSNILNVVAAEWVASKLEQEEE